MSTDERACWAPRSPDGCEGARVDLADVPMCEKHYAQAIVRESPFAGWSDGAINEWLSAMREVVRAHEHFRAAEMRMSRFDPSRATEHKGSFKWIDASYTADREEEYRQIKLAEKFNEGIDISAKPAAKKWTAEKWKRMNPWVRRAILKKSKQKKQVDAQSVNENVVGRRFKVKSAKKR